MYSIINNVWKSHWKPMFMGSTTENEDSWVMMQLVLNKWYSETVGRGKMFCIVLWHCEY